MPFDFADAKAKARRVVHSTFGVLAFYSDDSVDAPIEFRARWHSRLAKPFGDLQDGYGGAEIIEGIDRIVFIPESVDGEAFAPKREGIVTFPDLLAGAEFELDHREPVDGPLEQAWAVTRKK